MDREGTLKYLGVTWDLSLDPGVGLAQARDTLRSACAILDSKRATPECKKVALEVSLFRKVGYYARFINASLAEFRALEVPCNKLIRRITYNLPSYPTNLLGPYDRGTAYYLL
jgi:hypothetical protein